MADAGGEDRAEECETVGDGTMGDGLVLDATVHDATVHDGAGEGAASAAVSRLATLRRDAAAAYATISDADAALQALAGQRVAGERVLRHALARHQAASRALAAHARSKPGRLAHLLTGFRAGREWLARQADLNAVVREATGPLTAARRTVSGVKREFAAQVHVRAEAVAALRRLTAECVTVLAEIGHRETGLPGTGLPGTGLPGTRLADPGLDEVDRGDSGGANTARANQHLLPTAGVDGCHNK